MATRRPLAGTGACFPKVTPTAIGDTSQLLPKKSAELFAGLRDEGYGQHPLAATTFLGVPHVRSQGQ
jgi:hypothetical protein